ncbi:MAG: transcription antitermination factor NusB [Pseudomonadota bacterium]
MSEKSHQRHIAARKQARHYAAQALYQWHMAGAQCSQIETEFIADYDLSKTDLDYFRVLLRGAVNNSESLERILDDCLDRKISDLDIVELALLKVGAFELQEKIDVPYKVVINEYVNLAKKFGATDSHKYVNGVLDRLAETLRPVETANKAK